MNINQIQLFQNIKKYNKIIFVFIFSIMLYLFAVIYYNVFNEISSVENFLTWHNIFVLSGVFISFSIFTVTYFVYEESGSLKLILYGCAFLFMGLLDVFHTLSFVGMADFFIKNDTANRSVVFWVLSRLIGSLIFLKALMLSSTTIIRIRKEVFALITTIFAFILFYIVTYHPSFFPLMYIEGTGITDIEIFLEYLIIFILGLSFFIASLEYNKTNSNQSYTFMVALILLVFSEFAFTKYASSYDVFAYIGHIYKIIAFILFYKVIYLENISVPHYQIKQTNNKLKSHLVNLNIIVKERTEELEEANADLLMDIEYAKEMQLCLLPIKMPQSTSVSFDAEYLAAKHLSGDFYNILKLNEDNIAIYIGDVSGHGISAAMLTVFAYQNIIQLKEKPYGEIIEPGLILKTLYNSFNKTNIDDEKYIVMMYGIYNIKEKSFTYSSAGINVPPYIIKQSGLIYEMNVKGFPICKLGDIVSPNYENRYIQLETGDKILFYSDGLVEAKNQDGERYGDDRLKDFLKDNHNLNSTDLKTAIKNDFYKYIGYESDLIDDVTFLTMMVME